jgi:hypothetical protein
MAAAVFLVGCELDPQEDAGSSMPLKKPALDVGEMSDHDPSVSTLNGVRKVKIQADVTLDLCGIGWREEYSIDVELDDEDGVRGEFDVKDYLTATGALVADERGVFTCVAISADGRTARLGGFVTEGTTAGSWVVMTVVDNDGTGYLDEVTDLRFGQSSSAIPDFHCNVGFPNGAFNLAFLCADRVNPETLLFPAELEDSYVTIEIEYRSTGD